MGSCIFKKIRRRYHVAAGFTWLATTFFLQKQVIASLCFAATPFRKRSRSVFLLGLVVIAYTQYTYMLASLGCGPRDSLMVGLKRRVRRIPIGAVSIALLGTATLIGWLLGGPVGIDTLICAFLQGPIMQLAFKTVRFDATAVQHQRLRDSVRVFLNREKRRTKG